MRPPILVPTPAAPVTSPQGTSCAFPSPPALAHLASSLAAALPGVQRLLQGCCPHGTCPQVSQDPASVAAPVLAAAREKAWALWGRPGAGGRGGGEFRWVLKPEAAGPLLGPGPRGQACVSWGSAPTLGGPVPTPMLSLLRVGCPAAGSVPRPPPPFLAFWMCL